MQKIDSPRIVTDKEIAQALRDKSSDRDGFGPDSLEETVLKAALELGLLIE